MDGLENATGATVSPSRKRLISLCRQRMRNSGPSGMTLSADFLAIEPDDLFIVETTQLAGTRHKVGLNIETIALEPFHNRNSHHREIAAKAQGGRKDRNAVIQDLGLSLSGTSSVFGSLSCVALSRSANVRPLMSSPSIAALNIERAYSSSDWA
jgi:hypothetical protein